MKLLFCCEFYYPSVGGVQEVMRQVAERLARRGHQVTVATTCLANRNFSEHNGVKIVQFGVSGNLVRGIDGEVDRYRAFVTEFECDAILIKAAQQWTFDALFPILDLITPRKIFIPCGFSGLYEPTYVEYFDGLPEVLKKFDHLIFYSNKYRDVDFARRHGIKSYTILANGASEVEFGVEKDISFRERHGIPAESFVMLTVGSITGVKGHKELLAAFASLKSREHVTFIMNGNEPPKPVVTMDPESFSDGLAPSNIVAQCVGEEGAYKINESEFARIRRKFDKEGLIGVVHACSRRIKSNVVTCANSLIDKSNSCVSIFTKLHRVFKAEGLSGIKARVFQQIGNLAANYSLLIPSVISLNLNPIEFWISEARKDTKTKLLLVSDFERSELVQAYMAADLFVFASNIEYSPLVLFEAVAAGTPFLSVPVGNAEEIAEWTGCGFICPAPKDERGYTRVDPKIFAKAVSNLMHKRERLEEIGHMGREMWKRKYTWDAITTQYERILCGTDKPSEVRV